MCFSAEASFAAGAALLPAGAYCARIAVLKRPTYLPLALFPAFFGFQQIAEGFVWIGLDRNDPALLVPAALVFLAFALGFWPSWIPLSMLFIEERKKMRRLLVGGALCGLLLGGILYLPLALGADDWLRVMVVHHSIRYYPDGLPAFDLVPHDFFDAAYGIIVLTPFFLVSADRRFVWFRWLMALSATIAFFTFREVFVSVWCFFAAVLSAYLCYLFRGLRELKSVPRSATSP